jgi:methylmalonyl-CoA mutase
MKQNTSVIDHLAGTAAAARKYHRRMPDALALAADFPAATREEWRALVSAVLAKSGVDGDPEAALATTTYDGITINALYTAADAHGVAADGLPGLPPFTRGATAEGATATGWDVRQLHADPDPKRANEAILADLSHGATSVWLQLGAGVADLATALDGVYLDLAPIALDAGAHTPAAAAALLRLAEERSVDPGELAGTVGADPIGLRARTGAAADLAQLLSLGELVKPAPRVRLASVDATVYHDAGGSDADELAIATAVGLEYLRTLTDGGWTVDEALARLEFRFAVTADQFLSIAKLRAARRVWDRVAELCGAGDARRGQWQHAVTSAAMMTRRDPWTNLLRTTIACFAAAVGGADAITVLPFDHALGLPDGFARRIARNTQSVLHDESSLARVIDPAGGSWYVESVTDALAEAAWDRFTAIERRGGALAALDDGHIPELLARTRDRRAADIAHRRAPITGVSEYALVTEHAVTREPVPASAAQGVLPRVRYASEFEALRDRSDAAPERPRVFLAVLGPFAAHSARAGFAANLFQAAGIECVTGPVEEFAGAGTSVACLCSSDKVYAEEAEDAVKALRAAGADRLWLAGRTEVPGVDGNVYTGVDALDVLRTTLDELGVK